MRFFSVLSLLSVPYAIASQSFIDEAEEAARVKAALAMRAKLRDCTDSIAGWTDAMGSACSWYADEPARCDMANVLSKDDTDAEDVCCACGGGQPDEEGKHKTEQKEETTPTPMNLGCGQCENYKDYQDAFLSTCEFYEEMPDLRCPMAAYTGIDGLTALEACCVCGGGKKKSCDGSYYIQSASGLYLAIQKHGQFVPYINAFGTKNILTKLVVESVGDNLYSIRSAYYGDRYMCVGGDGKGVTTCGSVGKAAKWKINAVGDSNKSTLESYMNGKYLDFISVTNPNANYPVSLTSDTLDQYTKFKFIKPNTFDAHAEEDLEITAEKKNLRAA